MIDRIRNGCAVLLAAASLLYGSGAAVAGWLYTGPYAPSPGDLVAGNIVVTVDEYGNGTVNGFLGLQTLPFALQNDPGPGGLANVLTYSLLNPPGLTAGDVLFDAPGTIDPGLTYGGDVVRFNPSEICADGTIGCLVFYSDNVDGFDSLADTSGPPTALYTNVAHVAEVGTEGWLNYAIYTPTAGQPGFVAGADAPVTYVLISDVPEPASLGILLTGLAGLGLARHRRRRQVS